MSSNRIDIYRSACEESQIPNVVSDLVSFFEILIDIDRDQKLLLNNYSLDD